MKKFIFPVVVLVIVVGGVSFFAGMNYQEGRVRGMMQGIRGSQAQRRHPGQRLDGAGLTPVRGTIIKQDDSSITVELPDGGSKIVLLTDSTAISKSSEAAIENLVEGVGVSIFGKENSDGSVTATNVQLNPAEVGRGFQND